MESAKVIERNYSSTTAITAPQGLSLRINFSWTLAGNMVYAASQWGILIVLAKLGSPEMVGRFALALAITAPVMLLSMLQLRAVQATDARNLHPFGHYLALRLLTTVLALVVIAAVVFVAGYSWSTAMVILAMGLAKACESISDVFFGLMQRYERMDCIAKSMMLKGPLSLLALGITLFFSGSLMLGVLAMAAIWLVLLMTYDARNATRQLPAGIDVWTSLRFVRHRSSLWRLAWLASPLGIVMFMISLNTNIPRYFLENYHNEAALGYFVAMAYVLVGGNTVVHALGQSASPRLARYYVDNRPAFNRLLLKLVGIGTTLGMVGVAAAALFGREILTLLYRADYVEHTEVFVWLMVAGAVTYVGLFLMYGMTAARFFNTQLLLFALVAATSTMASWLLIPNYAGQGAAWAVLLAAVVSLVGGVTVSLYVMKRPQSESHTSSDVGLICKSKAHDMLGAM